MPCLIALIIFSILGIFSASHRKLAREAFDCVFRRLTLRPCDTGFDIKVKAKVLGPILPRFPKLAGFVSRYFEQLSWVFMILMTLSTLYTFRGIYNFWAWGDCNGRYATGGFCAFDPTGANTKTSTTEAEGCKDVGIASANLSLKGFDRSLFPTSGFEGPDVVLMGCYSCPYTRKAYPILKQLFAEKPVKLTFVHFPVKEATNYLLNYDVCLENQNLPIFWAYTDLMFTSPLENIADEGWVRGQLATMGVNLNQLDQCLNQDSTRAAVQKRMSESLSTGIYGTPTVFINGTPVVGPKPERVYRRLLQRRIF